MSPAAIGLYTFTFLLACAILAYTSYTDVIRRTINSFIFIPVVALGGIFAAMIGAPLIFIILGILIYLATYLETDLVIYPVIGVIFLAASFYTTAYVSLPYGFTLIIMSLMFLIGFQERLFGIGDVKAMTALFFTFTQFPFLTALTQHQLFIIRVLPLSVVMLFNIAVISLVFIPYLLILNRRKGSSMGIYSITSMKYEDSLYRGNEAKFTLRDGPSGKRMVYKTPFMISVSLGFIVTILAGFWFVFI